jgi:hypothetical protein
MGTGRWWEHPEVQEKLGLSPEQVEKLGAQRLETETKMIEVGSKRKIAHLRLRDLVSKKDSTDEDISKRVDEIGELQKEQMKASIAQIRSIRSILDEDQQKKVEEFLKARRDRAHRGPFLKGRPGGWDGPPRDMDGRKDKGPDKGDKKDRDGKPGRDGGDGDGPRHFRRGFGMAPGAEDGPLPCDAPGLPGAPPAGGMEFGGPAGPPEGPGEAMGGELEAVPFPPEGGPEFGWAEGDLETDLLLGDFLTFDEPFEDILAGTE